MAHPHIDVIWVIDVTPAMMGDGDAEDIVQVLLQVHGGGSRGCRPGYPGNDAAGISEWNVRVVVGEANCGSHGLPDIGSAMGGEGMMQASRD